MPRSRSLVFGLLGLAGALLAQQAGAQDAEAGERVFRKCQSCHMVGEGAKNRVGPVLTGVIGRKAGSFEDYRYGKSMTQAGEAGLVWDEEALFEYLAGPQDFLQDYLGDDGARAKMRFRLRNEEDRRDVIAYLASFSPQDADTEDEQAQLGSAPARKTAQNTLCVRNADEHQLFFAVEADGAERRTGYLEAGGVLCTTSQPGQSGMVSVFEEADALEGCSRLAPVGTTEVMLRYVDFDRCFWSSNT